MQKSILIILSIIAIVSCNKNPKKDFTYFGGKIINPKNNYVLLFKDHKLIDSIELTEKNTFMSKIPDIESGLYIFKHGPEHQYVYLEPNDSLLVRLNTWDFDKSLMFSGKGSNRNNILIETFVENLKEKKEFLNYYKLNPIAFKEKIETLKVKKDNIYNTYKNENIDDASVDFLSILEVALQYPLYTKSENFVRENYTNKTLDSSFLRHRKHISLNNSALMCYIPYRDYVYAHLYGDVYKKNLKKGSDEFTASLLENINAKIKLDKQRNRLLRHITIRHFYNMPSGISESKIFDKFLSLSTDERDKRHISTLLKDIKKLTPNNKIPPFTLQTAKGNIEEIDNLLNHKKSLIYFRGKTRFSDEWLSSRVNYLMKKNKNTNFIIVSVDDKRDSKIKRLNINNQYKLNPESEAYDFLNSKFPRVILVDENGIVVNNFTSLSSDKIEHQIAEL